jgi:RecB family exonuclease
MRASSWADFFDCPFRWHARNVLGLRLPTGGAAMLGTAVHAGAAVFDIARKETGEYRLQDAIDASREKVAHPDEDVDWSATPQDWAEVTAAKLTHRYCREIAPNQHYTDIELKCEALDVATPHGVVRLAGTTDRVRALPNGSLGIADLKTGSRCTAKNADGTRRAVIGAHAIQLGVYQLMAEAQRRARGDADWRMTAPAQIIALQTTGDLPTATGEMKQDATAPLLGSDEQPGLIEIAARMLRAGLFPPNPKSSLCNPKYCPAFAHGRCHYHA